MNKIFNNNLTNEEIDELVKKIINIPVEENKSCISSFGSINVDDLIKEIESLKKVPTYDLLLKENQQLKEKLELSEKSRQEAIDYIENLDIRTQYNLKHDFVHILNILDIDKGSDK